MISFRNGAIGVTSVLSFAEESWKSLEKKTAAARRHVGKRMGSLGTSFVCQTGYLSTWESQLDHNFPIEILHFFFLSFFETNLSWSHDGSLPVEMVFISSDGMCKKLGSYQDWGLGWIACELKVNLWAWIRSPKWRRKAGFTLTYSEQKKEHF